MRIVYEKNTRITIEQNTTNNYLIGSVFIKVRRRKEKRFLYVFYEETL